MKKNYVKPVFIAEAYSFVESYAAGCNLLPGDPDVEAIYVYPGMKFCSHDQGHFVGKNPVAEGITLPTTIFADGLDRKWNGLADDKALGCNYDWNKGTPSTFTNAEGDQVLDVKLTGSIANDFGIEPKDSDQHRPGYKNFVLENS